MARWRIAAVSVAVITGAAFAAPAGGALAVASHVSPASGVLSAAARAAAVASASGGSWGLAQPVAGATAAGSYPRGVASVSCATAGNCGAIGLDTDSSGNSVMFVVSESDGVWGASQGVRGPANLVDGFGDDAQVSCASPGDCSAVGDYYAGGQDEQGFAVSEINGVWRAAHEVPGVTDLAKGEHSLLGSVSCASAGNCSAGGTYTSAGSGSAFLANETGGTWGSAVEVPGIASLAARVTAAEITSVSCGSPGNCSAGGYFVAGAYDAFVVNETDGTWGNAELVPGLTGLNTAHDASITSVSCASPGTCSAGGYFAVSVGHGGPAASVEAFVVDETGGSWGNAEAVPGIAALNTDRHAEITSVSCASAGDCAAGGTYWTGPTSSQAFVVDESAGTWGTAITVPGLGAPGGDGRAALTSISCGSAGDCAAGGSDGGGGADEAFVASETNGTWGAAEGVPGSAALGTGNGVQLASVSCAAAGYCSAGGYYDAYGPLGNPFVVEKPFVVNEATVSATALTLTTTTAAYGNERGVGASVTVTSAAGGTPTGTVTVSAGPVTVCEAVLDAGSGDCTLGQLTLPAGSHQLTATYSGDSTYVSSASAGGTLTVSKVRSRTSVSISRTRLAYGQERSEKLSVTVAPQYAGVPAGKVIVRAGKATICVLTLRSGRGTCRFSARQLRPGKYHLTAAYAGNRNFDASSGSSVLITVRK
jgi:WD40 repeat protein